MKKVLVFGGSGFLGYYLVKELIFRNYEVYIADINKPENLNATFIQCDILIKDDIEKAFKIDYDYVYNLAGFSNLELAVENPSLTIKLNTLSNLHILDYCVQNEIKQFVYASSAYASSKSGSFYGISKLSSEKIIEEYNKLHNLNYTILRYGSVYSELKNNNNYIFELIQKAIENLEIHHNGDGNEIREYIHAQDAAARSADVIENSKFLNQTFILTGIEQIKRIHLFEMIKEISDLPIKINLNKKRNKTHYYKTPYSFQPSTAKKIISNPQIDLGQGLLNCIKEVYNKSTKE